MPINAFQPVGFVGRALALASVISLAFLGGCAAPRGDTGGRIDVYESTTADRKSGAASVPALLEFSDTAAQALARDLANLYEIRQRDTRAVLVLGSIENATQTPRSDFQLIARRTRDRLVGLPQITNNFKIVASRQRIESYERQEVGEVEDLLQESSVSSEVARYDPSDVYVLTGDFMESRRGDVRRYYFSFKLVNMATREIVFNESYDLGQS